MARAQAMADGSLRTGGIAGLQRIWFCLVHRLVSVRPVLTVFFALWAAVLTGLGPATAVASASQTLKAPTLQEQEWLPTVLTREGHFEIVIIKPEGSCPSGFQSRLDFNVSSPAGPDFLRVCAEAPGLLIYPRIWSGSEGIDLVVMSQRSCVPIAILVNNIDNGLAYVDFDARSHSPKLTSRRTPLHNQHETFRQSFRRTHRSTVDFTARRHFCGVAVLGRSPPPSHAEPQRNCRNQSQTRAPPQSPLNS